MGTAIAIVRHPVQDYTTWRGVYDNGASLRQKHGATDDLVMVDADDNNMVTVMVRFPSLEAGHAFAADPQLQEDMGKAGVSGPPRIEFNVEP